MAKITLQARKKKVTIHLSESSASTLTQYYNQPTNRHLGCFCAADTSPTPASLLQGSQQPQFANTELWVSKGIPRKKLQFKPAVLPSTASRTAWSSLHTPLVRSENQRSSSEGLWHYLLLKEKWDFHAAKTWFSGETANTTANLQVWKRGLSSAPHPEAVAGPAQAPDCSTAGGAGPKSSSARGQPSLQATLRFLQHVSDGENPPAVPAHLNTAHLLISALETRGKSSLQAEPELLSDANKILLRFRSHNSCCTCFSAARASVGCAASSSSCCLQGN